MGRAMSNEELKRVFKILNHCSLTSKQEELVDSLEEWFNQHGSLTPSQTNLLLDIYIKADA